MDAIEAFDALEAMLVFSTLQLVGLGTGANAINKFTVA